MAEHESERVVVGVDGSPPSLKALRWAIAYAERTGAVVEAFHAWQIPTTYGTPVEVLPGERFAETAERALKGSVAEVHGDRTVPVVVPVAEMGYPPKALVERSKEADLLVVGSRGRGGLAALLGSVSLHCVSHAACPVVVVRAAE
ncbi:universal stress protein [Glycomyces luteolus]|uniref:Universal stress protein n=1 Tax=Glycomyces luteolus TaxID=2670330 RepID=A0A9X3PIE9_9ACTN|nr:universal stress protein [Glycomyces luteolus]MDA1359090.1 universal stress protein [Glycomyces luteolus]